MATNTTNYSLTKPAYTDTADIADINGNMDTVDSALTKLCNDLAIVEFGNNSTHSISNGSFVVWKGDLYVANQNISNGAALSGKLTAVANGGLNNLNNLYGTLNSKMITGPGSVVIPAGSDFNSYTSDGVFTVPSDATAATISNMPLGASGRLIVLGRPYDAYKLQVYIPSSNAVILYARNYNNGTWTSWKLINIDASLIIHTDTVTTSASGTASFTTTYNTNEYMCLSVVTTAAVSGLILLPYKYGDAANGRWGLQAIRSGSLQPIANTSVSYVAVMYKYA